MILTLSQINKDGTGSPRTVVSPAVGAVPVVAVQGPSIHHQVPTATTTPVAVSEVCTFHDQHNQHNQTRQQQQPPPPPLTTSSVLSVTPPSPVSAPPSLHLSPLPSPQLIPTTVHQFMVHGHFFGASDDHRGPAPNVTVNPLYQPNVVTCSRSAAHPSSIAADQQIRVLTPSEIMRTLPSLCQETYEPPPQPSPLVRTEVLMSSYRAFYKDVGLFYFVCLFDLTYCIMFVLGLS